MGPIFVLAFWAAIASVMSILGGILLSTLVAFLTRGVPSGRKRAIRVAGFLPLAAFVYLFLCVIIFSVWSTARGRDMGWGDSWDTPILGSYHLVMVDVTDQGALTIGDETIIYGVRRLEVRPPWLLGTAEPEKFIEEPAESPDTLFFILDTRTGAREVEPSLDALKAAAQRLGSPLRLEPVERVYDDRRYTRADLIPAGLLAVLPVIVAFLAVRALVRLRATRPLLSSNFS